MDRALRIAILSRGRSHLCDLARELHNQGHQVTFYSDVPKFRTRMYGLPDSSNFCLLPLIFPLVAGVISPKTPSAIYRLSGKLLTYAIDELMARLLKPCDVFISASGVGLKCLEAAKTRYGAKIWLERGSRHVLSQKKILEGIHNLPKKSLIPDWVVQRELDGYEVADRIVIPAMHVEKSFIDYSINREKLFRNPYGVDLGMFPPTEAPITRSPTLIVTGGWGVQKGSDLLVEAWKQLENVKLIHVGSVVDYPLPKQPFFEHIPAVSQAKLSYWYSQAHVFVLPSRQEGLALVQAQALASGLNLVCSDRTGGEDLKVFVRDKRTIQVVPHDSVSALVTAIKVSLSMAMCETGIRDKIGVEKSELSWRAYGGRYHNELMKSV